MIRTFKHAGLEKFYKTGSKAGIQPEHATKLSQRLLALDAAKHPLAMNIPGWDLHELKGIKAGIWSIRVDRMWRLTFQFDGENAVQIDYLDYQ